jgi:hypothetical protein
MRKLNACHSSVYNQTLAHASVRSSRMHNTKRVVLSAYSFKFRLPVPELLHPALMGDGRTRSFSTSNHAAIVYVEDFQSDAVDNDNDIAGAGSDALLMSARLEYT